MTSVLRRCPSIQSWSNATASTAQIAGTWLTDGANGFRTPTDLPIAQTVIRAVEGVRGAVLKLPTMGGSLPPVESR